MTTPISTAKGLTFEEVWIVDPNEVKDTLHPTGYRLLVAIPSLEKQLKESGSLVELPDGTVRMLENASALAQVVAVGPDAYKDTAKFPKGPWCKEGDFIIMRPYSGTKVTLRRFNLEFRLINDDTVQAVVNDAAQVERV